MNKKLLFAALSLAVFTACTDDKFESQKQLAEETIPVEFEVINSSDVTRASIDNSEKGKGNNVTFTALDHDLFTLYHGSTAVDAGYVSGYDNATYEASTDGTKAKLTTPTMIKQGMAIMVWPCDTTFRITKDDDLTLKIPAKLDNVENNLPYVSDLVEIKEYAAYSEDAPEAMPTAYNTAGYNRKYPVYMRPMASQLNLKPNYIDIEEIDALADKTTQTDPIDPITIKDIEISTKVGGGTLFTTEIPLQFNAPDAETSNWDLYNKEPHNWKKVTSFNKGGIVDLGADAQTATLTSSCFNDTYNFCKFLFLPQADIDVNLDEGSEGYQDGPKGVEEAKIVVNTRYGQVIVGGVGVGGLYNTKGNNEIETAWYRFTTNKLNPNQLNKQGGELSKNSAETEGEGAGKFMTYSDPKYGLAQTINEFSNWTNSTATSVVYGEPEGLIRTRYVNVYLKYLDMSNLHIENDKQLRDVVRVWNALSLNSVTVYLDGGESGHFGITQNTIKTINDINAARTDGQVFTVTPCAKDEDLHPCDEIVITGSKDIPQIQNLAFIVNVAGDVMSGTADVVLQNQENWIWDGTVLVAPDAVEEPQAGTISTGINQIINRGKMANGEDNILNILVDDDPLTVSHVTFKNDTPGEWRIAENVTVRVQSPVINFGKVVIEKKASYLQDGANLGAVSAFTNDAITLSTDFGGQNRFGKVYNKGVFAVIGNGEIDNYALIEHYNKNAKTYITKNEINGANFGTAFNANTNKIGRINLPYSNKDEDNISISAALEKGFVSVTIDGEVTGVLNNTSLGDKVNYVIIKSGVTEIANLNPANRLDQVKYLEINMTDKKEIAWTVETNTSFVGLMVLSDVNIKIFTTVTSEVTYLKSDAKMYVAGTFNRDDLGEEADLIEATKFNGYYGNTTGNVGTNYITFN